MKQIRNEFLPSRANFLQKINKHHTLHSIFTKKNKKKNLLLDEVGTIFIKIYHTFAVTDTHNYLKSSQFGVFNPENEIFIYDVQLNNYLFRLEDSKQTNPKLFIH